MSKKNSPQDFSEEHSKFFAPLQHSDYFLPKPQEQWTKEGDQFEVFSLLKNVPTTISGGANVIEQS